MSTVKNFMGGGTGQVANIYVDGLDSSASVSCVTPTGATKSGVWGSRPNPACHNLPSGFQEVEYIEGTGVQYIDTAYNGNNSDDYIEIDCQLESLTSSEQVLLGRYGDGTRVLLSTGDNTYWRAGLGRWVDTDIAIDTNRHTISLSRTTLKVIIDTDNYTIPSSTGSSQSVYLFAYHGTLGEESLSKIKLYACKMQSTNSSRNYIPCYCTESKTGYKGSTATTVASGTVGLYDIVNDRFYVNCGSGVDFSKGDDVPSTISCWQLPNLTEFGSYVISATKSSKTVTETCLVDVVTDYVVEMSFLKLGLVAEWLFDDSLEDSSDNGYDLTATGTSYSDGVIGKAITTTKSNSSYAKYSGTVTQYTEAHSISAWIKISSIDTYGSVVLGNGRYGKAPNPTAIVLYKNGHWGGGGYICKDSIWYKGNVGYDGDATYTSDTNWHHFVVTQNSTETKFYYDGVLQYTKTCTTTTSYDAVSDFTFGCPSDFGGSQKFGGSIDLVRLYNRVLDTDDIALLYNNGQGA